ncbi:MAG: rod shape-determining protein MreD [bacterium]
MYWAIWVGIVILCLVLQTVYGNIVTICGIKPDFLLVIIIFFAFRRSTFESGIIGFIAGILQDSLSGDILGINAFTKLIMGLIASTIKKMYAENLISILLSIFVLTLVQSLLIFALQSIFVKSVVEISTMNRILLIALYNTVIGILVFPIFHNAKRGEE